MHHVVLVPQPPAPDLAMCSPKASDGVARLSACDGLRRSACVAVCTHVLAMPRRQGLGEGVALPCMNNLIATHVPKSAKARGLGMAFSGFHCGEHVGGVVHAQGTIWGWWGRGGIRGRLGGRGGHILEERIRSGWLRAHSKDAPDLSPDGWLVVPTN